MALEPGDEINISDRHLKYGAGDCGRFSITGWHDKLVGAEYIWQVPEAQTDIEEIADKIEEGIKRADNIIVLVSR